MNYQETIQYLFNSTPVFEHVGAVAYKPGLGTTIALDNHLGNPHHAYPTIHVAGTNGKGSCAHTLAAILQSMGLKVGLYTSPHILDFCERIKVNGESVSQDFVVNFVVANKSFFEPLHPSFFELTTAMALLYFKESKVDIAVIEVGLGGRLDSTNIITPLLSVITNISLDHTNLLGNTLSAIATEKAGIIKPNIPVVIGESVDETQTVFDAKARSCNAPIVYAEELGELVSFDMTDAGEALIGTRHYGTLHGALGGDYQMKNAATILACVDVLRKQGYDIRIEHIQNGFKNVIKLTSLRGRWDVVKKEPTVITDIGHNCGGWKWIEKQLRHEMQKHSNTHIVFGMVDDKDLDAVLKMLPIDALYYFTAANTHRAIPPKVIKDKAQALNLHGEIYPDVASAYEAALCKADKNSLVFVGGSNYVVSDFMLHLQYLI